MENCNTFCILSSSKTGPPLILQVSPYGKNTSSWIIPHSDFTCLKSMDFSYCVDINVLSSLITRTLKSHFQTTLMSFTNLQILQFANVWSKCVGCLTSKGMSDRLGGTGVDWWTGPGVRNDVHTEPQVWTHWIGDTTWVYFVVYNLFGITLLRLWNAYDICLCVSVGNTLTSVSVYWWSLFSKQYDSMGLPIPFLIFGSPKFRQNTPGVNPLVPFAICFFFFFGPKGVVAAISTFCACSVVRPYLEIAGKHSLKLTAVRTLKIGLLPKRKL